MKLPGGSRHGGDGPIETIGRPSGRRPGSPPGASGRRKVPTGRGVDTISGRLVECVPFAVAGASAHRCRAFSEGGFDVMRVFPGFTGALLAFGLATTGGLQVARAQMDTRDAPQLMDGEAATLTDKEKADNATEKINQMRDVLSTVNRLVEEARGERDALRLQCVNEKKTQISGLVKVAELALDELRAALKDRQTEAVDHEYSKVEIARRKVDGYKTEAEQCIGALAFYTGDVERQEFNDNKDTPNFDPTGNLGATIEPTPFRPPPASPTR